MKTCASSPARSRSVLSSYRTSAAWRLLLLLLILAAAQAQSARAQKHLVLQSAEDRRDEYNVILRKVFKRIYGEDVVLSVLCVPSFVPEEAAGILKTPKGYEAFALTL